MRRRWEGHRLHLSTVRHESPPHWIFKCKDVLESQDAELEVSQGSHVPKLLSTRRTMPLKSSKILSNPWESFEILPISIVLQFVVNRPPKKRSPSGRGIVFFPERLRVAVGRLWGISMISGPSSSEVRQMKARFPVRLLPGFVEKNGRHVATPTWHAYSKSAVLFFQTCREVRHRDIPN